MNQKSPPLFGIWFSAARPKTLWAGISPVIIGTAMAVDAGKFHLVSAIICLLVALSIQIGTNFANDYFDFVKGCDTGKRKGPTRATQAGLVTPLAMKTAFIGTMALNALLGLSLFHRAGWPIIVIAVLSIASGILYTGGPFPLGYNGLGDIFALIFFGPVALGGTYYVQALEVNSSVLVAGLAPGLFSVAMLTVNNLRDVDEDREAGKRTLAVIFGITFARFEYLTAIVFACIIPSILFIINRHNPYALISSVVALFAIPIIITVFTRTDGPALNRVLASTGKLLLVYSIVFSAGWNM